MTKDSTPSTDEPAGTMDDTFDKLKQYQEPISDPDGIAEGEWRIIHLVDQAPQDKPYHVQRKEPGGAWKGIWVYQTLEEARDCWSNH